MKVRLPYYGTNSTLPNYKPDIIIRDKNKGTGMLIYVIPGDRNVMKKEAEKILKYKNLITEIKQMSNVQATVISIIRGATGTIAH
jgi:hypothetical protein